jgi:hypothetical protein
MADMTPQQRCLAAIENRPVDRVPAYIPAISCEVAGAILGRKAYTGTGSLRYAEVLAWSHGEQAHAEFEQQMLQDIRDIYRALEIDAYRLPWRMNRRPTLRLDDYTFVFGDPDGVHSVWQYDPASSDFSEIRRGGSRPAPEEAIKAEVEQAEGTREARAAGNRAAAGAHQRLWESIGQEFFLVSIAGGIGVGTDEDDLLALEPEWMARRLMLQAEDAIEFARHLAQTPCPRVMLGGSDMAGNNGPMYSPAAFREVVLPAYRHAMRRLNELGVHYAYSSDGNLWSVADMLFEEAGVPGYGETDRDASMTVAAVRQRYPKLVIWGNFSSTFLAHRTAAEVKDEAKRLVDEADGRGYFQGCSNAIMKGTPPENVLAMFLAR